jgi:predicted DNA-binding transcriptional regulator YafY
MLAGMAGRKKGGYAQTVRALRMLDYLGGLRQGASLATLAERFGVTDRQVRRDLAVIDEAGHAVEASLVEGRSHARLTEAASRALMVSRRERYTLLAVRHVFDVLKGTPFHEDVDNVYEKLVQQVPQGERAELETLQQRFVYLPDGGTKAYRNKTDIVDELFNGVLDRRILAVRYAGASGKLGKWLFAAYGLVLYKNGLYAIGHKVAAGEDPAQRDDLPIVCSVERFVSVAALRKTRFVPPAGLRLAEKFAGSFGIFLTPGEHDVVVEFDQEVRGLVEARVYHATQKNHPMANGGLRVSFTVVDLKQVASWVLGFGNKARVLEPPELVTRVRNEVREMARMYR